MAMGMLLLALLAVSQEDPVGQIMQRLARRRERILTHEQHQRLLADARAELERVLKAPPDRRQADRAAFHLAQTYFWGGEFKTALGKFRDFLRDRPDAENAPAARYAVAETLLELDDDTAALEALDEFLKEHPSDERALSAHLSRGVILRNRGKYEAAAEAFRETRRLFPDRTESWNALLQLAVTFHAQERNAEARRLLEEVIRGGAPEKEADAARALLAGYLPLGTDAPSEGATDAEGNAFSLGPHRGSVVIVYFFTPGTPLASPEAAGLRRLADDFKGKDLRLLGVAVKTPRRNFARFRESQMLPWPLFYDGPDPDGKIARLLNLKGPPSLTAVDRKGKIRFFNLSGRDLRRAVEKLLEEK